MTDHEQDLIVADVLRRYQTAKRNRALMEAQLSGAGAVMEGFGRALTKAIGEAASASGLPPLPVPARYLDRAELDRLIDDYRATLEELKTSRATLKGLGFDDIS